MVEIKPYAILEIPYPCGVKKIKSFCTVTPVGDTTVSEPGRSKPVRIALWDTGSTSSVISERVVRQYKLKIAGYTPNVRHIGGASKNDPFYYVRLWLKDGIEFPNLKVGRSNFRDFDVLIGMDNYQPGRLLNSEWWRKDRFLFSLSLSLKGGTLMAPETLPCGGAHEKNAIAKKEGVSLFMNTVLYRHGRSGLTLQHAASSCWLAFGVVFILPLMGRWANLGESGSTGSQAARDTRTPRPPTATPRPTPTWEEWQDIAEEIPYKTLFRYAEQNKGKIVRYRGKVIQVLERRGDYQLRVNVTKGEHGFWEDTVWLQYDDAPVRILDDDIVSFVGRMNGPRTLKTVLGGTTTLPEISVIQLVIETE